ncbi:CBS domain-containing protein [Trichloromonas sp.]|uniref:CBS domain-containing protein n=1 Tax=Trichloromonas sp. TaxID=3069249 RepID=UPI002A4ABFB1|nr:CBS domain-containing protein [Trichloromonas sp.]
MLTAKDIMTTDVHTVTAETEVDELARLFARHNVNALPVVDSEGHLEGVVTETDLVEQDKPLHIPTVVSIFDWVFYLESEKTFQDEVKKITARKVGEICSREVTTCAPDTPVADIAGLMVDRSVHLVPVVEGERLVGVVARFDIIRSMRS